MGIFGQVSTIKVDVEKATNEKNTQNDWKPCNTYGLFERNFPENRGKQRPLRSFSSVSSWMQLWVEVLLGRS